MCFHDWASRVRVFLLSSSAWRRVQNSLSSQDFRHKKIHIVQERGQRVTEAHYKGRLHDCHFDKSLKALRSASTCAIHSSSHPPLGKTCTKTKTWWREEQANEYTKIPETQPETTDTGKQVTSSVSRQDGTGRDRGDYADVIEAELCGLRRGGGRKEGCFKISEVAEKLTPK